MRAADVDRQVVADRLRVALDEGRLDLTEYDERLQGVYAARTYGQLDALLADLPAPAAPARSQLAPAARTEVSAAAGQPGATRLWLARTWQGYLGVVAVCVAVWLVTSIAGGWAPFWPAWVAGPWGAVLLMITINGLLTGEPQRAEQRAARQAAGSVTRPRRSGRGCGGRQVC